VINALDEEFKKSSLYEWHGSSENKIWLRLGISTVPEPSGAGSIVCVVLAGVNDRGEPLILSQYSKVVPDVGSSHQAASFIIEDLDRAIEENRPMEPTR
jgi:hypothetical protein